MHREPKPTEISSGLRQKLYANPAHDGDCCARSDPAREIIKLIPKAKLSSLPRNHLATAVVTATISDSAPKPKIKRPLAITVRAPDKLVTTAPKKHSVPKIKIALRVPIRST